MAYENNIPIRIKDSDYSKVIQTKEDFIYYLLFTAEQLQLNPEEFPVVLMGSVNKNDDLFNITYKYVRHVSLLAKDAMLYSNAANSKHFTLLNSL